jgi:hypothetical protein
LGWAEQGLDMSRRLGAFLVATALCCGASGGVQARAQALVHAQPATAKSVYDPASTFAALVLPDPVNAYRSANGAPGPAYWQNRADYDIQATLDVAAKQLRATETIAYTNNSPDVLTSLWVQLDQNTYRRDARATLSNDHRSHDEFTDGYAIDGVEVERDGRQVKADWRVSDTRMQVTLPEALKGAGGRVKRDLRHRPVVSAHGGL